MRGILTLIAENPRSLTNPTMIIAEFAEASQAQHTPVDALYQN